MMKAATVGAIALVTGMASLASAQQWGAGAPPGATASVPPRVEASADPRRSPSVRERAKADTADVVITESHIARLRTTLKLTPAQVPHWAPVEAALHELARQQARGQAAGFSHKLTDRSSATAATATQLRRLKAVAMPLIQTLDDSQKRDAVIFARNLGFQQLVAAF